MRCIENGNTQDKHLFAELGMQLEAASVQPEPAGRETWMKRIWDFQAT